MENACELAGTFEPGPIPAGRSVPLQTGPIRRGLCHGELVCIIIYELESFGLLGSPFDHLFYFPSLFLISFLIFFISSSSTPRINRGRESGARIMQQLNDILEIEAFQNCHFEHLFTSICQHTTRLTHGRIKETKVPWIHIQSCSTYVGIPKVWVVFDDESQRQI